MQIQDVVPRLVSEFAYTNKDAERIAGELIACSPEVRDAFQKWWRGEGLRNDAEIQGYTLQRLMDEYKLQPIAALLTLDWIVREPDGALAALEEGYDVIEPTTEDKDIG